MWIKLNAFALHIKAPDIRADNCKPNASDPHHPRRCSRGRRWGTCRQSDRNWQDPLPSNFI
jgi:hypothetical protein